MQRYLNQYLKIVATKADKVSRNEMVKNVSKIRKVLKLSAEDVVIPVSALKRTGQELLLEEIEKILNT